MNNRAWKKSYSYVINSKILLAPRLLKTERIYKSPIKNIYCSPNAHNGNEIIKINPQILYITITSISIELALMNNLAWKRCY